MSMRMRENEWLCFSNSCQNFEKTDFYLGNVLILYTGCE